jgi:flagellar motor switch protein FliG
MGKNKLNGIQKIAVLLAVVNRECAARLLRVFDADEQQRITQGVLELENIDLSATDLKDIIDEFRELLETGGSAMPNVEKTLAELLSQVHGADDAKKRLAQLREESRTSHPFRGLRGIRGSDLARILQTEHPQIQAVVLAHLDHDLAAQVLDEMPEAHRTVLVTRMANMDEPPARLVKQLANEISERARGLKRVETRDASMPDPRLERVARILLNAAPGNDKAVLEGIGARNEELATKIRERMFEWDDLKSIDKKTMQRILADIDTRLLAMSLKGCDEAVAARILGSVSQRTGEMIKEERDLLGSVPVKEVIESRKQILTIVRDLISRGEITVARGKEALYVS